MTVTYLVLATQCLNKNAAHNLQLVCSFPCIMLMQFFLILLLPFGVGVFKQMKMVNFLVSGIFIEAGLNNAPGKNEKSEKSLAIFSWVG